MAISLYGPDGTLKAVALRQTDRLRLTRQGKRQDRLVVCECAYPHYELAEAEQCAERIMTLTLTGTPAPEIDHGPRYNAGSSND